MALARKTCPRCGATFDPEAAYCPTDGSPLIAGGLPADHDPYIGTMLHGDIEIRRVAGAGAMGRVYIAHQRGIERDVAVKILHRELSGNAQLVQRFHREAKIASKLQHPHVVEVFLAGQLPDGALYIVMEYLDGHSLATALAETGGVFPPERALAIALQISDAVGAGHARGIVHRDLKPENVMLVRRAEVDDWVKVLDFGIAKVNLGEQSMETAAGLIFGTARYISPEGAQGSTVGPPGDVYSIATIVYQMLAGRTPFEADQPVGFLIKHIHEEPRDLRVWPSARHLPEPVARVIMDNLAKEPGRRAPSARAFASVLAAAARESHITISDAGVVARFSQLDVNPSRPTVEPTLDDVPAPPVPLRGTGEMEFAATAAADPVPREVSSPPFAEPTAPKRRGGIAVVALAFALGAAVAALVTQQVSYNRNAEHDAHVAKARRALASGHYLRPDGENVRDLVATGLSRWPDDEQLVSLRSDAAHELVTRAMAARSAGDLEQARDHVKTALEFDPSDRAAAILLDQYDDELRLHAEAGAGGAGGAPKVLLTLPPGKRRASSPLSLVARVAATDRGSGAVQDARFTTVGPGLPAEGLVTSATLDHDGAFRTKVTPPREGTYEIVFEANIGGVPLRAERTVDVER